MTALGVDVVEDDRLDIQSLLPSMCHHRPAHLWNTNMLTLDIGIHALNTLTLASSSTFRGHTIDGRNIYLIMGSG